MRYSAEKMALFPVDESFIVAVRVIVVLSGAGLGAATTFATTGATLSGGVEVVVVVVGIEVVVVDEDVVMIVVVVELLVVVGMVVVTGVHSCSHSFPVHPPQPGFGSHTSPFPLPFASNCCGLQIVGQLSTQSGMPSPSLSGQILVLVEETEVVVAGTVVVVAGTVVVVGSNTATG